MNQIKQIEAKFGIDLPASYKALLKKFDDNIYLADKKSNKDFVLSTVNELLEDTGYLRNQPLLTCEKLKFLVGENTQKQVNGMLGRHDEGDTVLAESVANKSVCIGSGDGSVIYLALDDNLSVWEYWKDDSSVGKLADDFDAFITDCEIETYD